MPQLQYDTDKVSAIAKRTRRTPRQVVERAIALGLSQMTRPPLKARADGTVLIRTRAEFETFLDSIPGMK